MEALIKENKELVSRHTIYIDDFRLADGRLLASVRLHFMTWGKLNHAADNVVWIVHGLTANADVAQWWPGMVGSNEVFTPEKHFIICVNIPGSCYGSSLPHEIFVDTDDGKEFVQLTPRDVAQLFNRLAEKLGVKNILALAGASVGGFVALEWALLHGSFIQNLVLVATSYFVSPWNRALNETQLMALENAENQQGMAVARAVAMLSYRTPRIYNDRQAGFNSDGGSRAASYQRYQGAKLAQRFSAQSYRYLIGFFNAHDVADFQQSYAQRLGEIRCKVLIIGFLSDLLFPVEEQRQMYRMIPKSNYAELHSDFGHDAFLVETKTISAIVQKFLKQEKL